MLTTADADQIVRGKEKKESHNLRGREGYPKKVGVLGRKRGKAYEREPIINSTGVVCARRRGSPPSAERKRKEGRCIPGEKGCK